MDRFLICSYLVASFSTAAELVSALLVAVSAFQLIQSVFIRLKWELGDLFSALGAFPISLEHLARSIVKLCHFIFLFLTFVHTDNGTYFNIYHALE